MKKIDWGDNDDVTTSTLSHEGREGVIKTSFENECSEPMTGIGSTRHQWMA